MCARPPAPREPGLFRAEGPHRVGKQMNGTVRSREGEEHLVGVPVQG